VPAADQAAIHLRRLTTAGLLTSGRVPDLRRVDAEVANLLHTFSKSHVDGVAVHDAHDDAFGRLALGCRDKKKREKGEKEAPPPPPARHAATVSFRVCRCQELDTGMPTRDGSDYSTRNIA
jgi:hypothetical protein